MWSLPKRVNRTTLLMLGCAAFLIGLVLARRLPVEFILGHRVVEPRMIIGWLASSAVLIAAFRLRKGTLVTAAVMVVAGLLLGMWRGSVYLHQLQPYQLLAHKKVTFTATANIDAVYGKNSQLAFVVRDVRFTAPQAGHVPGTLKVSGFGVPMIYRGDQLQVSGSLYPTRGANQASVGYAELTKTGTSSSVIDTLRRKFAAGMQSALPEPLASFGLGLLVGQRNTLPEILSQALLMVGLTHIIAVSGYNLTILLHASRRLMGDQSKVLSTAVAVLLIAGFLLIAGTSASIVRAAVISLIGLSAWYYGRSVRPVLLILLAAAGTAYANPVYIWADISWYLSFLAFCGILLLGPLVTRRLYGTKEPPLIPQIIIESLCAEVLTLPLILFIFGQMSLVSLLANMLVASVIPLAMLLSFVAGLAGMLVGGIAGWLAWPAHILLTYMVDVVNVLSRIPHVFQQNRYLSTAEIIFCYAALVVGLCVAYSVRRTPQKPGHGTKTAAFDGAQQGVLNG
jgi:ComEC/Rec2-related protein